MYRDDLCAVCGASLPPDHFYCREHAADVDDRLHAIAARLPDLRAAAAGLRGLFDGIAEETWDYLAESVVDEPEWPPEVALRLRVDNDQVDVDVDDEPGYVRIDLRLPLAQLLAFVTDGLSQASSAGTFVKACADAAGANATH